MKCKLIMASFLFVLISSLLPSSLCAEQRKIVWRMAYEPLPKSSYQVIIDELPNRIMKISGGLFEIDPSPRLIPPSDYLEATRNAVVNMGVLLGPYYRDKAPIINICSLPWIFRNIEKYQEVVDSFLTEDVNKILREKFSAVILMAGVFPNPVIFSRTQIRSLEDLKGLKVRVPGYEAAEIVKHLGAQIVNIPGAEVVHALGAGVVDAAVTQSNWGYEFGFYETTKYVYNWQFGNLTPWFILANRKAWEGLREGLRRKVEAEFKRIQTEGFISTIKETEKSFDLLKEKGVEITQPSGADISKIKAPGSLNPVYKHWVGLNEKKGIEAKPILAKVLQATGTGGHGDPCYYPTCRCSDGSCKIECCRK
jgi:TRAP-type C4-dicarboxylate transport system substrate-binding protein